MNSQAKAFLVAVREASRRMPDGGRILAITYATGSRTGGVQPWAGMGSAKAAMESLVRYFAVVLAKRRITVNVQLLIPAAGMGTRLGSGGPKALVDLGGKPMIAVTLSRLLSLDLLWPAIIVVPPDHISAFNTSLCSSRRIMPPTATSTYASSADSSHGVLRLMSYSRWINRRF